MARALPGSLEIIAKKNRREKASYIETVSVRGLKAAQEKSVQRVYLPKIVMFSAKKQDAAIFA